MKKLLIFLVLGVSLTSCMVDIFKKENPSTITSIDQLNIPSTFNFATTRNLEVSITTLDNGDVPLRNIVIELGYRTDTAVVSLGQIVTDLVGTAKIAVSIPSHIDSLIVMTDYLGLPSETSIRVESTSIDYTLGGKSEVRPGVAIGGRKSDARGRTEALAFNYMGSYDAQGVPTYLEPVNDYIPQDLLDLVNATLPEREPVPTKNPQYINSTINPDTRLSETADVWITFVHEGAGYVNSLGYYTYDLGHPPTKVSDIAKLNIVFPNVSLPGSGGNLRTGNKVYLGKFPPNTGIGWFLVPNGWTGSKVVETPEIKYSTKALNTYTTDQYRQQIVLLKDDARELLLLGVEDLSRPGGDNDFNDAVFFVSANPYSAVINDSNLGTAKTATGTDSDGDGVIDRNDQYPNDALKAFDVYNPGENIFGTLAFEDQWPSKGDYDLNDLILDYNYQFVTNTNNAAIEIRGKVILRAIGASYHNGFGVELPVSPDLVESVAGTNMMNDLIEKNLNGTEAGQTNATIVLFTDAKAYYGTGALINTKSGESYVSPIQIDFVIRFKSPVRMLDLGYPPFNPFLFIDGDRGMEVHLPDMRPTSKADLSVLGTMADSSVPATGRYYKAGNNLPWAINLATTFDYPQENKPINEAYLKFGTWSQSAGTAYKDWYLSKAGYRDNNKIYKK